MKKLFHSSVVCLCLAGAAQAAVVLEDLDQNPQSICDLDVSSGAQILLIRGMDNYDVILDNALANCPSVAQLLATASADSDSGIAVIRAAEASPQ